MKRIVVLTATRAEYGLLSPIIKKLYAIPELDVQVVATGMHLSPEFGMTVKEIEEDGIRVDKKIEILLSADTHSAISKTMGLAMISFADYFEESRPDALLVLGDRYETLAVCCAAMNARIPIFHMYGGDTTEGAIDEAVRHAITKMSYLHLTATDIHRTRVIQMGEDPVRVFTVGSTGVENALHTDFYTKEELESDMRIELGNKYAVATFHPVTLEDNTAEVQIKELLNAVVKFPDIKFIFTKANADANGRIINETIKTYAECNRNLLIVDSLGMRRYLSAIKYAAFVIGNSSSGIAEVPSFGIPTINIGDRQRGRFHGNTVIDCKPITGYIESAIKKALDREFLKKIENEVNPYGDGNTSDRVAEIISTVLNTENIDIKKKFFDIHYSL